MSDRQLAQDVATVQSINVVPRILELVCRATGMGFAAVARVTEERWIACAVRDEIEFGLQPGGELDIKTTLCDEIRQSNTRIVIDHADKDPRYCAHHTAVQYNLQSYISVPLRYPDGRFFGTLCAVDPRPALLNDLKTIGMFEMFADLIGFHLDAADRLALSERTLAQVQQDSALRDQFIAVLSHDLRNPLTAIQTCGGALSTLSLPANAVRALVTIERSTARMMEMVGSLTDLARAHLGGGLPLQVARVDLRETIEQVVAELESNRQVVSLDLRLNAHVQCDSARIAQLLSNLLSNALRHGQPNAPVRVSAWTADELTLTVENHGAPVPAECLATLFHPFARSTAAGRREGLGLGLYIAAQIAHAHSGTLTATCKGGLTTLTFRMPLDQRSDFDSRAPLDA